MITINSKPPDHTPVYNEQYFVIASDNTAQLNFNYHCKITVDGIISIERIAARPDNGKAYFNPQRIIEAFVNNKFDILQNDTLPANENIKQIDWEISDEYGSPPTIDGASTKTGTYFVWNGVFSTQDYPAYVFGTTTSSKLLANITSNNLLYTSTAFFLSWHRGFGTRKLYYLIIKSYDAVSGGTLIQTATYTNLLYNDPAGNYRRNYLMVNCSPNGFNLMFAAFPAQWTISNGALAIVPNAVSIAARYEIHWEDNTNAVSSPTYTVYIDNFCSKYNPYILYFLNKLGGYDTMMFSLLNRKTTETKRLNYKKVPWELNASNNLIYSLTKGDKFNYNTIGTNKITLNTYIITDAQAAWLKELLQSPSVIMEDNTTGELFSVQITDSNYEPKQKVNDKTFNLTLNLEFTYEDIRQRG